MPIDEGIRNWKGWKMSKNLKTFQGVPMILRKKCQKGIFAPLEPFRHTMNRRTYVCIRLGLNSCEQSRVLKVLWERMNEWMNHQFLSAEIAIFQTFFVVVDWHWLRHECFDKCHTQSIRIVTFADGQFVANCQTKCSINCWVCVRLIADS